MLTERFRQLLAAYGTDPRHWPEAERDAALQLLATEPAARAMMDEERWLNDLLDAYDPAALSGETETAASLPRQLPPQRRSLRVRLADLAGRWAKRRASAGGRSLWPQVATLTMASLVGAMIGWNDPPSWFADPVEPDLIVLLTDASSGEELLP